MLTNCEPRRGPRPAASSGRIPGNPAGPGGDLHTEPPGCDHEHRMRRDQG